MGPDTISAVVDAIGVEVTGAMSALIPVGQAVTGAFVVLAIVLLGLSLVAGGAAFIGPLVRLCAAGAGTYWAISDWPAITLGTLHAARAAVGLLLGGYAGPATLFQMASDVAGRVNAESAVIYRIWDVGAVGTHIMEALCAVLIWLGLSLTGLLAVLAEFELLIGGAVAPLVLPALAFGLTRSIGFGPVTYMVSAGVRVVVMGTVSYVMAQAVTTTIKVPGTDQPLSWAQDTTLLGVALLTAVVGISCNSLARGIVGGNAGALGLGSAFGPLVTGLSVGSTVARAAAGGVSTVAGAVGAHGRGGSSSWRGGGGSGTGTGAGGAAGGGQGAGSTAGGTEAGGGAAATAGSGGNVAVSSQSRSAFG